MPKSYQASWQQKLHHPLIILTRYLTFEAVLYLWCGLHGSCNEIGEGDHWCLDCLWVLKSHWKLVRVRLAWNSWCRWPQLFCVKVSLWHISEFLIPFEYVWTHLTPFEPVWSHINPFEPVGTFLILFYSALLFVSVWLYLTLLDSFWSRLTFLTKIDCVWLCLEAFKYAWP